MLVLNLHNFFMRIEVSPLVQDVLQTLIALTHQLVYAEAVTLLTSSHNYQPSLRICSFNVYPTLQVPDINDATGHVIDALFKPNHL